MKRTLSSLIAVLLISVGCATSGIQKEDICSAAITVYAVYLAVINADGNPSEDQITAAKAAAIVLQTQCGWTQEYVNKRNANKHDNIDANGVLVLLPPR